MNIKDTAVIIAASVLSALRIADEQGTLQPDNFEAIARAAANNAAMALEYADTGVPFGELVEPTPIARQLASTSRPDLQQCLCRNSSGETCKLVAGHFGSHWSAGLSW